MRFIDEMRRKILKAAKMNGKKRIAIMGIIAIMWSFSGCSSDKMKGVSLSESGELRAVTFELPEGKEIEEVLGSEIGSENTIHVTTIGKDEMKEDFIYWYKVNSGGIVSKKGNIYRYGPNAELGYEKITNDLRPPNWLILVKTPSDEDLFDPEDAEKLEKKYGVKLSF